MTITNALTVLHLHATRINVGDDVLTVSLRRLMHDAIDEPLLIHGFTNQHVPWEEASPPCFTHADVMTLGRATNLAAFLAQCDAVIVGGGEVITNAPELAGVLKAACELSCNVLLLGVGVNLKRCPSRVVRLYKTCLPHVSLAWVRDEESRTMLNDLGVPHDRIHLLPDLAYYWVSQGRVIDEPMLPRSPYGVVSLRMRETTSEDFGEEFFAAMGKVLDRIANDRNVKLVFLPMVGSWQKGGSISRRDDTDAYELLINNMTERPYLFSPDRPISAEIAGSLLANASFAITMRLHASILASMQGTPVVPIGYARKVWAWAREVGLGDICVPATPAGADLIPSKLERILSDSALSGRLLEETESRRRRIAEALPELSRVLARRAATRPTPSLATNLAGARLWIVCSGSPFVRHKVARLRDRVKRLLRVR